MGLFDTMGGQAGYSIFAHSRPDKIGIPRLLPLYLKKNLLDYRQKKPLKYMHFLLMYTEKGLLYISAEKGGNDLWSAYQKRTRRCAIARMSRVRENINAVNACITTGGAANCRHVFSARKLKGRMTAPSVIL